MQLELSEEQSRMINALISDGRFGSAEEVISKALSALTVQEAEYQETIADVQASVQDEEAGRYSSIHDVARRIRGKYGLAAPHS